MPDWDDAHTFWIQKTVGRVRGILGIFGIICAQRVSIY